MTDVHERPRVPSAAQAQDMLQRLLERRVTLRTAEPLPATASVVSAVYRDDDSNLAGLVLADTAFANIAGAALGMLPAALAQAATNDDCLDRELLTNYHEVANVAARWFNAPRWPHVTLATVHAPAERTPLGTLIFRAAPRVRGDFTVNVDGYGEGRISILAN